MFTCIVQYDVLPDRIDQFRDYARTWIRLIIKYGGVHHGFFSPPQQAEKSLLPEAGFSFPGIATSMPENSGFAVFSFRDIASYEAYREAAASDEACIEITRNVEESACFQSYTRGFFVPQFPENETV